MGKTARKTVGVAFKKGADARRGAGKPGRSGRKPNTFIAECSGAAEDLVLPKVLKFLKEHEPDGLPSRLSSVTQTWQWCADYVTGYGKGKPVQPIDQGASIPHEEALAELE